MCKHTHAQYAHIHTDTHTYAHTHHTPYTPHTRICNATQLSTANCVDKSAMREDWSWCAAIIEFNFAVAFCICSDTPIALPQHFHSASQQHTRQLFNRSIYMNGLHKNAWIHAQKWPHIQASNELNSVANTKHNRKQWNRQHTPSNEDTGTQRHQVIHTHAQSI